MRRLNKLSLQDQAITAVYDLRDSGEAAFDIYFGEMRHALLDWASLIPITIDGTQSNSQ